MPGLQNWRLRCSLSFGYLRGMSLNNLNWIWPKCSSGYLCLCHSSMFCLNRESVWWPGPGVSCKVLSPALGHGPNTQLAWTLDTHLRCHPVVTVNTDVMIRSCPALLACLYFIYCHFSQVLVTAQHTQHAHCWNTQCQFSWGSDGGLASGLDRVHNSYGTCLPLLPLLPLSTTDCTDWSCTLVCCTLPLYSGNV